MVIAHTGGKSKTGTDEEITHDCLKTGLATLEVRASHKSSFLLSKLENSRVKSVLRRAIEKHSVSLKRGISIENRSRK